ncbi:MAG: hypothetical protein ACOVLC_11590 [Flavobacterium sp.]
MKKLTMFVLLFVTAISFANNVESNSLLENATEVNQLELNASDDEDVHCHYTTTRIYSTTYRRKVISLRKGVEAYEEVIVIHSICTTCYHNEGSSTACIDFD